METNTNASTILGFKYSEEQAEISLSPPKSDRSVSYLRRMGDTLRWVRIPEPHHDSNKLYASFKGIPTCVWLGMDLEDLGLETEGLSAAGVQHDEDVQVTDFIGSGWINSKDDAKSSIFMVACRQSGTASWRVFKLRECLPHVGDPASYHFCQECDIIVPMVQPKRVMTEQGVYFVG